MVQLVSSTKPVFRVLVSRRHVVHRESTTLAYRVECFLSLPLDPFITLSSSHFTRGKIASECNVTFERYRIREARTSSVISKCNCQRGRHLIQVCQLLAINIFWLSVNSPESGTIVCLVIYLILGIKTHGRVSAAKKAV